MNFLLQKFKALTSDLEEQAKPSIALVTTVISGSGAHYTGVVDVMSNLIEPLKIILHRQIDRRSRDNDL
ncbi:hypothetical protein EVAR_20126_1 [Eumeta japonica]|uniref:Uncharacterized protein n=1 Tax=Eumeta variegata TaxID=151549 RepID=A0A4C1V3M2_EUMVA|nr:hypothetical protein EVAR_20126_1 [Eumeta japonica]